MILGEGSANPLAPMSQFPFILRLYKQQGIFIQRTLCLEGIVKQSRFARLVPSLLVLTVATVVAAHSQTYSVLYNFGAQTGGPWAGQNNSGMIAQGRNGSLYSAGEGGGTNNYGAAYAITTGGSLTVLHSFNGSDGYYPAAGLILGTDGYFYGTTLFGGACGNGTIYRVTPGAFATLRQFSCTDGLTASPPTQAMDGNYYGVTDEGGALNYGEIYRMTPSGQFSVIYQSNGSIFRDEGPLRLGNDAALYGASNLGGAYNHGAIFKITTTGQFTSLYSFDQVTGAGPEGGLYQATDGNFYGVTHSGGAALSGVVFKITPAGAFTILHEMNGTSDGKGPLTGPIQGTDGNFYGATSQGGIISTDCPSGCGTLFKITPQGTYTVLHSFTHADGDSPWSAIYQHTNGRIYGTTRYGGTGTDPTCNANCGVFFSLDAGLAPYAALSPFAGARGSSVTILGQGFTKASGVTFGGAAATFTIVSDTCIVATVPTFANSGRVTVSFGRIGNLASNRNFIVR
jgi:uncharacterized repeat protein (TIGR03803 family)